MRERRPNTEFFLVRIFLYSDKIRRFTNVLSPNTGKYGPGKTPYLDTFHAVEKLKNIANISFMFLCNALKSVMKIF